MNNVVVDIEQTSTLVSVTETSVNVDITQTETSVSIGNAGPQGAPGDTGPANSLSIGTVATGDPGTNASASITGTAPDQTLSLTIPRGATGNFGVTLTPEYYYDSGGTVVSRSFALNYAYYVPYVFPGATTISRLGALLITIALTNSIRLGLYNSVDNRPYQLLAETGAISTGTGQATGFKYDTVNVTADTGLYYLAFVNQGSVPSTFSALQNKPPFMPQGSFDSPVSVAFPQFQSWMEANVTGALPATATPVTLETGAVPRIFFGVAA